MGDISQMRRVERFRIEFGDLALKEYGLPDGTYLSQDINFDEVVRVARIYVTLQFPSGTYELMVDKIIFDPELMDEDLVQCMIEEYEHVLDTDEIIRRLKKAELIEQNYKEEPDGQAG